MMPGRHIDHYKNWGKGGDVCFLTTTCLDFVPLFASESRKEFMVNQLIDDHKFYGSDLHSFVIMSDHLHWISQLPEGRDVSWFVGRIKSNAAKKLVDELTEAICAGWTESSLDLAAELSVVSDNEQRTS